MTDVICPGRELSAHGLRHELFVYDDDGEFLDRLVPWVKDGLDAGEPVLVIGGRASLNRMRDAVHAGDTGVTWLSGEELYTRPEAAIAGLDRALRRHSVAGAVATRAIGELPRFRDESEWRPWLAYEAIANRALAHHNAWVVCPCDSRVLPTSVLDGMYRTHPHLLLKTSRCNPLYEEPELLVRELTPAPEQPLQGLRELGVAQDPRGFRDALRREMDAALISDYDASKLLVAAGELYGEAYRNRAGLPVVCAGRVGDHFVCELTTPGAGHHDELAGYVLPAAGASDGTGMWVARQLTERLEVVQRPAAVTVRLWI